MILEAANNNELTVKTAKKNQQQKERRKRSKTAPHKEEERVTHLGKKHRVWATQGGERRKNMRERREGVGQLRKKRK